MIAGYRKTVIQNLTDAYGVVASQGWASTHSLSLRFSYHFNITPDHTASVQTTKMIAWKPWKLACTWTVKYCDVLVDVNSWRTNSHGCLAMVVWICTSYAHIRAIHLGVVWYINRSLMIPGAGNIRGMSPIFLHCVLLLFRLSYFSQCSNVHFHGWIYVTTTYVSNNFWRPNHESISDAPLCFVTSEKYMCCEFIGQTYKHVRTYQRSTAAHNRLTATIECSCIVLKYTGM